MADQSIFGNEQPATQPNTPVGSNPQNAPANQVDAATLLSSIKNERGEQKYSTVEAALEGLRNAQEFIPTLKQQTAEKDAEIERLRVQAERAAELERTLAELTSQREQQQATPPAGINESQLADLVNRTLTQREQAALAQSNITTVTSTLQNVFGTDAEAKFYGKAQEMGMSVAEMNALAAKSPKAVLTMLGVTQPVPNKGNTQVHTPGTVNTAAYTPQQETFVGRNPKPVIVGATTQDINESMQRAKKMVEELHAQGKEVHDLTNPKVYFKFFNP
jgi:hypothetical protein